MSGFNLLHLITKSQPRALRSCSLPSGAHRTKNTWPLSFSEEELRKRLTPMQYHVTQERGTERAFPGEFTHHKDEGTYTCVVCGALLFSSNTKFDSSSVSCINTSPFHTAVCMRGSCANSPHPPLCESFRCGEGGNFAAALIRLWRYQGRIIGWPSFFDLVGEECVTQSDDFSYGMHRVETACSQCGAHLGHLFDDGPRPTGKRYCINSAALAFQPKHTASSSEGGATSDGKTEL